jgi:hypothetical protein
MLAPLSFFNFKLLHLRSPAQTCLRWKRVLGYSSLISPGPQSPAYSWIVGSAASLCSFGISPAKEPAIPAINSAVPQYKTLLDGCVWLPTVKQLYNSLPFAAKQVRAYQAVLREATLMPPSTGQIPPAGFFLSHLVFRCQVKLKPTSPFCCQD